MTLQGILLDIDGTIVLSNDSHAQAWVEAFGHKVNFEQVRPFMDSPLATKTLKLTN